jgi:DNA-directed RNA polymerase specialized sigma24 family protein
MNPTAANLWHGYSLDGIDRLATAAAHRATGRFILDPGDTYEAAWGAIAEHLATADEPPPPGYLLTVAYGAIGAAANQARSYRGMPRTWGADAATAVTFCRYWELHRRATGSPEGMVIDRRALAQIWPTLTVRQQQTLWALAAHDGDHRAAAQTLGWALTTFRTRLSDARAAYRALWHEHETPSGMWGRSGTKGAATATRALVARHRARERRAAA